MLGLRNSSRWYQILKIRTEVQISPPPYRFLGISQTNGSNLQNRCCNIFLKTITAHKCKVTKNDAFLYSCTLSPPFSISTLFYYLRNPFPKIGKASNCLVGIIVWVLLLLRRKKYLPIDLNH